MRSFHTIRWKRSILFQGIQASIHIYFLNGLQNAIEHCINGWFRQNDQTGWKNFGNAAYTRRYHLSTARACLNNSHAVSLC